MNRFYILFFAAALLTTSGIAQEQTLGSTPIMATLIGPPADTSNTLISNAIALPPIPAVASSHAVGPTPTNAAVSPSGAFTYEVPIAVPPGVQDVQPNIALTYNSQSGNGLAGWGWNISGLSTISRVGSTLHHDGEVDPVDFDALDRFALDGQRLIATSGTYGQPGAVYSTENYSNIKITSYETHPNGSDYGPKYFVVHYPDGSRAYYGDTENSSNELEWVITKWVDAQGNQVNYYYTYDKNWGNLLRLDRISYGETQSNEVLLQYKDRSRGEVSYVGGNYYQRDKMLSSIEVKHSGRLFRTYTLTHQTTSMGYQRISQIQESNGDGEFKDPVIFNYESNETEISIYPHFLSQQNLLGVSEQTAVLTGNFNSDSNLDVVTYDSDKKNNLSIITGITKNEYGSFKIGHTFSVPVFKEVFPSTLLTSDGAILSQQGITTLREEFSNEISKTIFTTINMGGVEPLIFNKKEWLAPIRTDYLCNDTPVYDRIPEEDYPIKNIKRAIPKTYVSGDFNGDGLTDVLAINKNYTQVTCDPPIPNCNDDNIRPFSERLTTRSAVEEACDCQCDNYSINRGVTYLIDLDPRKTSNFAFSIGSIGSISNDDQLFAADFDGDGKTDLWHITDKEITVYSVVNKKLQKSTQFSNDWIKTDIQILKGDFNGDGKLDFLIPKENNSKEWRFLYSTGNSFSIKTKTFPFRYKKNYVNEYGYIHEYHFFTQDYNQDGKSDVIRHFIKSREAPYGNYTDGSPKTEYYNSELFELFENKNEEDFERVQYIEDVGHFYDEKKYLTYIKPIFAGLDSTNKKMQYAVLSGTNIRRYDINTPHKDNMRLSAVTHHGQRTQIDYAGLDATENGSVYSSDTGLQYPFVHINHAPGMELVSKLTQTASGHTRTQQFKYKGAVSHMHGLGFMGFTGLARSNLYGDNVSPLWTVSKQDPNLRGATTEQWTDTSYSFDPNCYINKTVTGYKTELRSNKIYVSVPKHMATHNNLTDVLHERFFTYDSYFNLASEREKTEGLDKTTTYQYFNNPSPTDTNYHIGRLKWEKSVAKVPGAADFWTEKSYTFQNNLLDTESVRANGSNWRTSTYGYDLFGNVTSKSIAIVGKPARSESFTYYPNGRDMHTHTNVLGLTTTYEYFPEGMLKKETDPYGNSIQYTYDGWNRLYDTTNYLGRTTTVRYAHRTGGGTIKTIDHPNTAADTKTYYNALGWVDEVHTQVSGSQWSKVFYEYDAAGRVVKESVPDFSSAQNWNTTYYDLYGRVSMLQQATGKTINTVYDGLRTQVDDGLKTASTTKNALDQIVELADPGGTITYSYHANGELREADYGGYVVTTELDNWGRKSKLIDPTAGTFTYTHNDFGELLEETAPKGQTDFVYDDYGRMTQKTWTGDLTDMVTHYHFNADKLLEYETTTDNLNNTTHRIDHDYDAYKRLQKVTETSTHATFSKTLNYDYYGRIGNEQLYGKDRTSNKTYNTNVIYNYDLTGAADRLSYQGASRYELWRSNERNALGQVVRATKGNDFEQTKTIDAFGFVTAVNDQKSYAADERALDLSYNFDVARGILRSRSDTLLGIRNQQFVYDDMDRLTEAHRGSNNLTRTRTRGYDPRGRLTQDSFMGVNLTYGSGNDRYKLQGAELNPIGTTYYNKHKERNISYNADRKPVDVHDVGNGRITFNYSHDGHRQEVWYGGADETKTDRQYHKSYSRIAPIELVRNTENNTVKFMTYVGGDAYTAPVVHVQDSDSSKPSGHHYLHRDYLGSILAVSNSSGKVIERAHFGAWGDEVLITTSDNATTARSDSLTGRGFTGHEHFTEVGLIHMNGRMYDAQQGRFLSPDNHIQDPFNTQNFNRFGYVLNNPLSLTDPSGEFIATLFAIVKVVSLIMTAAQTLIAIASGAPIGQVLIGIGIGVLAGLAGGALATGIKGVFSAATTAVGAFVRGAISAFGGQLISGTLASVAQGTSFRKALRANFAPAGIAAAAGGFAGASEFKANQKALSVAKAKRMVAEELDAMAQQASDSLSGNMTTADQLAANANAAWGPGDIQLGELQPRLSLNESYSRYVEALEGWPYELGANGPTAYDCSSTVLYGMRHTTGNYNLGDYTADDIFNKFTTQASWGERGDLLFYDWNSDAKIDHVTTILGGGKMLHSSSSSNILKIVPTSKPNSWYPNKSVFIRRINWGSLTKKR